MLRFVPMLVPTVGQVQLDVGVGEQIFSVRRLRKDKVCGECSCDLYAGHPAYGVVARRGTPENRALRICVGCVNAAILRFEEERAR